MVFPSNYQRSDSTNNPLKKIFFSLYIPWGGDWKSLQVPAGYLSSTVRLLTT
jgi:hypothetical protein